VGLFLPVLVLVGAIVVQLELFLPVPVLYHVSLVHLELLPIPLVKVVVLYVHLVKVVPIYQVDVPPLKIPNVLYAQILQIVLHSQLAHRPQIVNATYVYLVII
jgi:hypothetical protein